MNNACSKHLTYSITNSRNVSFNAIKVNQDTSYNPPGYNCHTGTQAQLSNKLYLYRFQMMGTIRPGYINTRFQCYAIQGHKPSYATNYILIPNDGDGLTWLYQHRVSVLCHTGTQGQLYNKLYILIPNDGDDHYLAVISKELHYRTNFIQIFYITS